MATPPLTKEQKKLNDLIKRRHSAFKKFTYYDYNNKIQEAQYLLKLYHEFKNSSDKNDIGKLWKLQATIDTYLEQYCPSYKYEIPSSDFRGDIIADRQSLENKLDDFNEDSNSVLQSNPLYKITLVQIKKLFGIDDTLATKLLHSGYMRTTQYEKQIEEWCRYSQFVRRIIKYIKENQPRWEHMTKKEKKSAISAYDILQSNYFSDNDAELLKYYPDFIDKYGLNNKNKAIADKLFSYNFPKMTPLIAKQITEQSTKNKKI
ncbi:hypothetical protein MLC52_07005 [Sulfurimonas sp. NW15]|uniref:hypothetical protein n=1 Tax=Sulfurimonas sp. NW15 TaxID=2922729 RepID=UPI003DA7D7E3